MSHGLESSASLFLRPAVGAAVVVGAVEVGVAAVVPVVGVVPDVVPVVVEAAVVLVVVVELAGHWLTPGGRHGAACKVYTAVLKSLRNRC